MSSETVDIDTFKRWSVPVLKIFLKNRGLSTKGKKEELVALAYSASVMCIDVVKTSKEEQKEKAYEYADCLKIGDVILPDPLHDLDDGWVGEADGCSRWPPTMYYDICNYLDNEKFGLQRKELRTRLMTDYKEGKAYSYFSSGWLKDVGYHQISKDSTYCFLKAECTPSMRVNNVPHTTWVCTEKTTGVIQSAYCSCFAGLGGTCNHIAAILFKVDYAWQWGINNKACTSKPCLWKTPGNSGPVQPKPLRQMELKKPHYSKGGRGKPINHSKRQLFQPSKGKEPVLRDLMNSLVPACPDAAVFQLIKHDAPEYDPAEDFNVSCTIEVSTEAHVTTLPEPLPQLGTNCSDASDLVKLKYTDAERDKITKDTIGQSSNPSWSAQRAGRITASHMHSVFTKSETLAKRDADTVPLVSQIMGYNKQLDNIPALKYGRTMEAEARKFYEHIGRTNKHQNLKVTETGIHIHAEKAYLGATPDALVECDCCGAGLLEIKCPLSVAHTKPDSDSLKYLHADKKGNNIKLRHSHPYYTQIQGQLAVCDRPWCDFFVYSKHGHHIERIEFDETFWDKLQPNFDMFFEKYIAPELISQTIRKSTCVPVVSKRKPLEVINTVNTVELASSGPVPDMPSMKAHRGRGKPSRWQKKVEAKPVYLCGSCKNVCLQVDEIDCDADNSVCCDTCGRWLHWGCAGYVEPVNPLSSTKWHCSVCLQLYVKG